MTSTVSADRGALPVRMAICALTLLCPPGGRVLPCPRARRAAFYGPPPVDRKTPLEAIGNEPVSARDVPVAAGEAGAGRSRQIAAWWEDLGSATRAGVRDETTANEYGSASRRTVTNPGVA